MLSKPEEDQILRAINMVDYNASAELSKKISN